MAVFSMRTSGLAQLRTNMSLCLLRRKPLNSVDSFKKHQATSRLPVVRGVRRRRHCSSNIKLL